MKLDLYIKPTCPYCMRVVNAIDDMGDAAAHIEMRDISSDATALQTLVEVGGKQQVPCLFVDGKPMYESADIINWLRANC
ncbi:glutaredoxin [Adlercreutzia sp. ZJ304]|uniref:glutaredoxin family protein n=1 Tax=Adlercreutzia sp. ZJ304 TaxID=2709791 RepID=UPI0013E9CF22|nr:glutaredoxin [Adlercreutzia sp. ZJ304]